MRLGENTFSSFSYIFILMMVGYPQSVWPHSLYAVCCMFQINVEFFSETDLMYAPFAYEALIFLRSISPGHLIYFGEIFRCLSITSAQRHSQSNSQHNIIQNSFVPRRADHMNRMSTRKYFKKPMTRIPFAKETQI